MDIKHSSSTSSLDSVSASGSGSNSPGVAAAATSSPVAEVSPTSEAVDVQAEQGGGSWVSRLFKRIKAFFAKLFR